MPRPLVRAIPAFVAAAAILGAGRTRPLAGAEQTLSIEPLPSPASGSSAEPQLTVEGDKTILSWVDMAGPHPAVRFAERTPSGWSDARGVVSGHDLVVNSADVPSVRALADGTLAAHWLQQNGSDPEAYDVRLAWSKDEGRTWTRPVSPHHDATKTMHGFASLFQAPGAGLGVVWLDGRSTNPEAPEGQQGDMSLRAAIYGRDGKQLQDAVVDTRVCECCSTAAAATSDGVVVAYRNRSADEIRDIHVSRLAGDRWNAPTAVHNDGWKITACPINGPAISARGPNVAVAWFNARNSQGQAFAAFSRDGARTFGPPIRVDDKASLGRVGVELVSDAAAVVTWVEFSSQGSQLRARLINRNGTRAPAATIAAMSGTRYPRVARGLKEVLFAWTESSRDSSRVRIARAPLGR